jgi:XTP/dITP diphosphohydrolase
MPTIVLATGNPHKVEELRAIFASIGRAGLEVMGLNDIPGDEAFREPEEVGATCEANARIKAVSYAEQIARGTRGGGLGAGVLCLADDSGIEIDSLKLNDGTPRPGVISSHYSTDGRETGATRAERDAANNARVLREMQIVPEERRGARFVCCMCLVDMDGRLQHETRGTMEGRIGEPPRVPSGEDGFGYDPLFLVAPEYARTGAELSSEEKNRLSHRGVAARRMGEWILATAAQRSNGR